MKLVTLLFARLARLLREISGLEVYQAYVKLHVQGARWHSVCCHGNLKKAIELMLPSTHTIWF